MKPSTERIVNALIGDDDYQETSFAVLLTYLSHLKVTRGASFKEIHAVLSTAYFNLPQGESDTLNTHI